MQYLIVQLLINMDEKFVRAPGYERSQDVAMPGEKSLNAVAEGTANLLNTGFVTLLLLPVLAALLYVRGYRLAGPVVGLFALGLFLARILGAQA